MTNLNRNTVTLTTGKVLHDFQEVPFIVTIQDFEVIKGIAKLKGITTGGRTVEIVSFDQVTVKALSSVWGTKVVPGTVYEGLLPYREWSGRYGTQPKHQLYLDARGREGARGVFTLKPHTADVAPAPACTDDTHTVDVTPTTQEALDVQETQELLEAQQASHSTPLEQDCPCRKTKSGECHKTDAKKYH